MEPSTQSLVRPDLVRENYGVATNLAFNEYIRSRIARGEDIYHFGFGQSPFPIMEEACQALAKHAHRNDYLPVQGIPELREAICSFHQHYDGVTLDPFNVIVGPGSKELILLLMTIFNGDVLLNSPSWTTYKPQAQLSGKSPVIVESSEDTDWKITPVALTKVLTNGCKGHKKLLIFTNPCNPTGTCYTEEELRALTEVFRQHDVIVLSDEIYGRLHFEGKHVCLAKVYPEGTVLSTGLSKWASAGGWRVGYHVYPKELLPLLNTIRSAGSHSYSCAPSPMQFAVTEVLQNRDACDDYIQHCTRILKAVASFTVRHLCSAGLTVMAPQSGYYAFPNFEVIRPALAARGVDIGKKMCDLILKEAAVALLPGGPDNLRPSTELTVRLCYIDFDGRVSLEESRRLGLGGHLDDAFVQRFCPTVYKGIKALQEWVLQLRKEQDQS